MIVPAYVLITLAVLAAVGACACVVLIKWTIEALRKGPTL